MKQCNVIAIDLAVAEECIQKKAVVYDGDGDQHYDTIALFLHPFIRNRPDEQ